MAMKNRSSNRISFRSEDFRIIKTSNGLVEGSKRLTLYMHSYYSYLKIPYAKAPIGELRFCSPQPIKSWFGTRDCTKDGNGPLQINPLTKKIQGSEDCLYLNIYVKTFETPKNLPVMVYLYGDHFQFGEASSKICGPDYFMQEEVLLCTVNYRLGALGFLSLSNPELEVPGNAGLRDQLAALYWIHQNCARFNGDPDNITLFGNGAGGVSTHYHTLEINSKGLFHKAIFMSGSVFNEWTLIARSDYAFRLAKRTGYKGDDEDKAVLKHLRQVDATELVGLDLRTEHEILSGIQYVFGPTIEPYVDDDCFIRLNPELLTKNAWGHHIPVMIGGTSFEGLYLKEVAKVYWQLYKDNPTFFVPVPVQNHNTLEENKKTGQEIILQHKLDPKLYRGEDALILKMCEYFSYRCFWVGANRFIKDRVKNGDMPVYLYRFDFDSSTFNLSRIQHLGKKVRGVTHKDDLSYLFYHSEAPELQQNSDEYKIIRRMVAMFTSFARNGNPNCEEIRSVQWKPITLTNPYICLNISKKLTMMQLPEAAMFPFWDKVYEKVDMEIKKFEGKF